MKKNRMMRLASVLLVCVLLTTSVISGTYAKYVTTAEGSDSARVAKWGVTVDISGSLFGENYYNVDDTNSNKISASVQDSVDSSDAINEIKNIVAPGTKSDGGIVFTISGTPEVDYAIKYENMKDAQGNEIPNESIWLAIGNYGVLVETNVVTADNYQNYYYNDGGEYKKADVYDPDYNGKWYTLRDEATVKDESKYYMKDSRYYPLTWMVDDLNSINYSPSSCDINEVIEAMSERYNTEKDLQSQYPYNENVPNKPINQSHMLYWRWSFGNQNDGADTILGNLMAYDANSSNYVVVKTIDNYKTCVELEVDVDYNLYIFFGGKITIEQVD